MKFLVFTLVIAFIFEDYGTFQGRPIDKTAPIERAQLFKKYLLELVNAAIPALRENREIMEQGCECIPIIEENEKVNTIDLFLTTMSIAKDYYSDLHVLRQASDVCDIVQSKRGLMKNVQKILVVFQSSPQRFQTDTVDGVIKKYVLKRKQGSSAAATSTYDESLKQAMTCYRSMISLYHGDNETYVTQLIRGFQIAAQLMYADDKDLENDSLWYQLDTIIEEISVFYLSTPDSDYLEHGLHDFLEWLNVDN